VEQDSILTTSERSQALVDIRKLFDNQRFGVLATHCGGQPYASLVAFAASDDLRRLVFCTLRDTRKYANLVRDPRAALLVHSACNDAGDFEQAMGVTVTGAAIDVTEDDKVRYAEMLISRHPELSDFVAGGDSAIVVLQAGEHHLVRRFQDMVRIPMQ